MIQVYEGDGVIHECALILCKSFRLTSKTKLADGTTLAGVNVDFASVKDKMVARAILTAMPIEGNLQPMLLSPSGSVFDITIYSDVVVPSHTIKDYPEGLSFEFRFGSR